MAYQDKLVDNFCQPGAGTWCPNGNFNFKACILGKVECYTGPCICLNHGTGLISCMISALIFPFSLILGTLIGIYNWIMCDACLKDNKDGELFHFQDEYYRVLCPCGCNYLEKGFCDIFRFWCGTYRCKCGPCICFSRGNGFLSCLIAGCCFPISFLFGMIIGIYNWITCGSCAPKLNHSDISDMIYV